MLEEKNTLVIDKCSSFHKYLIEIDIKIELKKKKTRIFEIIHLPFLNDLINSPSFKRQIRDVGGLLL